MHNNSHFSESWLFLNDPSCFRNAFNDTIRFREAGINAVTFGPGEDGWNPDNESISITKAVMAARMYALTIMDILEVDNDVEWFKNFSFIQAVSKTTAIVQDVLFR